MVPSREFYREYHGHKVEHLQRILQSLRPTTTTSFSSSPTAGNDDDDNDNDNDNNNPGAAAIPVRIIWMAGDSSLDNKYWFEDQVPAVPPYDGILYPPVMKPDVAYWLNHHLRSTSSTSASTSSTSVSRATTTVAVNAAVEATTLNERTFRFRPQDDFIRDNLQPQDILLVSVGGNDVALCPLPCTVASVGCLALCLPSELPENGCTCGTVPFDDYCCGCGPSLLSCLGSCPPCAGYVHHLLGTRVEAYVRRLTSKTKPDAVLVCTIYYPDENRMAPSWAGAALSALGYNSSPDKLQRLIRLVHERATSRIRVEGVRAVIPVPLFRVLDGQNTADYVARVEPSPMGGRKMAEYVLLLIQQHEGSHRGSATPPPPSTSQPVVAAVMHDRDC
jgi:hypothetical protein